jgi:hypothetical protein
VALLGSVLAFASETASVAAPLPPACREHLRTGFHIGLLPSSDHATLVVTTVPGTSANGVPDLRVDSIDRASGASTPASRRVDGTIASGRSVAVAVSGDARFILFRSTDDTVVAGDTNGIEDLFLRDTSAGTTRRVSVGPAGSGFHEESQPLPSATVSDDGSIVAFTTRQQLVAEDADDKPDVYLWRSSDNMVAWLSDLVITPESGPTEFGPVVVSPDAATVVFIAHTFDVGQSRRLYRFDVGSGTTTELSTPTSPPYRESVPSFTGDSATLLYESTPDGSTTEARMVDLAAATNQPIAVGESPPAPGSIRILRDGTGVAFAQNVPTPFSYANFDTFVQDLSTGILREVGPVHPPDGSTSSHVDEHGTEALDMQVDPVNAPLRTIDVARAGLPSLVAVSLPGQPRATQPIEIRQGDTATVRVEGGNLHLLASASAGPGVTVTPQALGATYDRDFVIHVDGSAPVGPRSLSVVGDGGCTATRANVFNVVDNHPVVDLIEPAVLRPGQTTEVAITGNNLAAPLTATTGTGVEVIDVVPIDANHAVVELHASATAETAVDLTLTNGSGLSTTFDDAIAVHDQAGEFTPLDPTRILDTRQPGAGGPVGPQPRLLEIAGAGGVPSTGAVSVVMNVTVTEPSFDGFLTAWPTGLSRPVASNLNFHAGQTIANLTTVPIGADGKVQLAVNAGVGHVIVDVVGYYASTDGPDGGRLHAMPHARLLDTREMDLRLGSGEYLDLEVAGRAGLPEAPAVRAAVLNLTAVDPDASTFLTAWPGLSAPPTASNLNVVAGQTAANLVVVPVAADGFISIYNHFGGVDVLVDLVGWFDDGAGFQPVSDAQFTGLPPSRILDTRDGTGAPAARVDPAGTVTLDVTGRGGVPAAGVSAVLINVTAVLPTQVTYLTAYASGTPRPWASNSNPIPGRAVPNLMLVQVGSDGNITLYNHTGQVDLVADVVGWYSST